MKIDNEILYARCPCGSGNRFKFCCFKKVRDTLRDNAEMADVVAAVRCLESGIWDMFNEYGDEKVAEAEHLNGLGIDAMDDGRFRSAIDMFRKAREKVPNLFIAWNNEALSRISLGDFSGARECARQGAAAAPSAGEFGWATLAIMAYATRDDAGYDAALSKAMSAKPIDKPGALQVCQALACAHRHEELFAYASGCGFESVPEIAYLAGVAAANCGDNDAARKHLGRAMDDWLSDRAKTLLEDMDDGKRTFGLFDWLYFDCDSYPFGLLSGNIPEDSEYGRISGDLKAYTACDRIEIELADRECNKKDALLALSGMTHPRAAMIREHIAGSDKYDRSADELFDALLQSKPGTGGGTERRLARLEKSRIEPGADTLPPVHEFDPDYGKYVDATNVAMDGDPSHPGWDKAKKDLLDFNAKHPCNPRALMNYCGMLSAESRDDEAWPIVKQLYERFPGYAFAASNMANYLIAKGSLDEAEHIMDGFDVPDRISPEDCVSLLKTETRIASAREMHRWALQCVNKIARIRDEFNLPT